MPPKNSVKKYEENGYYHVYNRGVEKRDIFQDDQDYGIFLKYLKTYLSESHDELQKSLKIFPSQFLRNYELEIELICYCLMPNHYHLLLRQHSAKAMPEFIRSISTRYAMYFNKKYERVGSLFQGRYKAVKINTEEQLVNLTHYIHRNPTETWGSDPQLYKYSSIHNYFGEYQQKWIKCQQVLDLFSTTNPKLTYRSFVLDVESDPSWGSDP